MFKYEGYAKGPAGNFTKSKLGEVSNKVSYTVGTGVGVRGQIAPKF